MSAPRLSLTPKVGKGLVAFHILSLYWFFLPKNSTVVKYPENAFLQEKLAAVKSGQARGTLLPKQQQTSCSAQNHRGKEALATKASLEQSHCTMGLWDLLGHNENTLLLTNHRQTADQLPLFYLILHGIYNFPFSFSISIQLFLLPFLVLHTCDFFAFHHRFSANKTICTTIATF